MTSRKALQPRLRDIIVAVLRLPQQRVSPLPEPPHAVGQQHLSSAPAPHRVPSPQEMRLHTQHILQQALIKRKLEEQKENFRKRQENRDKCAPLDGDRRRQASSTAASLAFTPTAVIRNMKAEARSSPEHRPKAHIINVIIITVPNASVCSQAQLVLAVLVCGIIKCP
ncbi:hypothetical protein FJT64_004839 [Amphibalanus amphitrite]|uniref:Uncharacterized protein n=1 Tax=Amphibalanus amphitrite TaxID=1232801 RepID=A0A6A4W786_AMPAM|nr:hypothetical protein FJT64_004839 [Amphibalanus amphitrite]